MNGRPQENPFSCCFEPPYLQDDRNEFHAKNKTDDGKVKSGLDKNEQYSDDSPKPHGAGIAHDNGRRRRIKPQERKQGADNGADNGEYFIDLRNIGDQ